MLKVFAVIVVAGALLGSAACDYSRSPSRQPLAPTPTAAPAPAMREQLDGATVVARVVQRYPERLVAVDTLEERVANMEFLRDRIVEVGICSGLHLAWNRKMSGIRSIDAINWRHGDQDINDVVDLALDYDNASQPLQLHWLIVGGPAGWDPYPAPTC